MFYSELKTTSDEKWYIHSFKYYGIKLRYILDSYSVWNIIYIYIFNIAFDIETDSDYNGIVSIKPPNKVSWYLVIIWLSLHKQSINQYFHTHHTLTISLKIGGEVHQFFQHRWCQPWIKHSDLQ